MHTRHLSQTLAVSSIGYGAMGLSEFYGQTDDTASLQLLHTLIDLNITLSTPRICTGGAIMSG